MKKLGFVLLIALVGCAKCPEEKKSWTGEWDAKWTTNPAAYGNLGADMKFEMNGKFNFECKEMTLSAFGYENCIFGVDTLEHTQLWRVSGDTLMLENEDGDPGMHYRILSTSENEIRLLLVDDIYVTLTK